MQTTSIDLTDDFLLGKPSESLSSLLSTIHDQVYSKGKGERIEITVHATWFDLSLLLWFGQVLRRIKEIYQEVDLRFPSLVSDEGKIRFLWEVGFWQLIGANMNQSNLRCFPNPWNHIHTGIDAEGRQVPVIDRDHSNFTSFIHQQVVDGESLVRDTVNRWNEHLRLMEIYSVIKDSDLIQSQEYLFLLVWELILNAVQHSEGKSVGLASQIYIPKTTFLKHKSLDSENSINPLLIASLEKQYSIELNKCILPLKKNWLIEHGGKSFLLIACSDDGIGIPNTIRRKGINISESDKSLLEMAFNPDISSKRMDPDIFDVHGLSQVLRLVKDFDGYLFLKSGISFIEYSSSKGFSRDHGIDSRVSEGTLFQIILPIEEAKNYRFQSKGSFKKTSLELQENNDKRFGLSAVLEEIGRDQIKRVSDLSLLKKSVLEYALKIENAKSEVIFFDFTCMPRNRQFVSYLLRTLRKTRLLKGMVVVNASKELIHSVQSLERLTKGLNTAEYQGDVEIFNLDKEVSTILTRGEEGHCLPLLIPFSSFDVLNNSFSIKWLGLSGIRREFIGPVEFCLNYLFYQDREVSWEELSQKCSVQRIIESEFSSEFLQGLRSLIRCNGALFERTSSGCRLRINESELFAKSHQALKNEFNTQILPKGLHNKKKNEEKYLYDLPWHKEDNRFRIAYYQAWKFLINSVDLEYSSKLLISTAYAELGEDLLDISAVVSVTPPAGLLGRKIAEQLGVHLWEIPSIHELDKEGWLPDFKDSKVVVVCDVFDSGVLTDMTISRLKKLNANVIKVISLIANSDSSSIRTRSDLIFASEVSLGIPDKKEILAALKENSYFEIDPHSLEPIPAGSYQKLFAEKIQIAHDKLSNSLQEFTNEGVVGYGHFVHNIHHYDIYFNLAKSLKIQYIEDSLYFWFLKIVNSFFLPYQAKNITIVYPYHSPIYHFVNLIQKRGIPEYKLNFIVSKPKHLPGGRLAYFISDYSNMIDLQNTIFLDDGIASGGTIASLLEELIECGSKNILGTVIFNRIGFHPTRHLKYVSKFHDGAAQDINFQFHSYFSVNLQTYTRSSCPFCRLSDYIKDSSKSANIVSHSLEQLQSILDPQIISMSDSELESRLAPEEVLSIILFNDAVYSGLLSSKNLEISLEASNSKTARVVLENLTTVMLDAKLNQQMVEKNKVISRIKKYYEDQTVDTNSRIRFILFTVMWQDKDLALDVVARIFPNIYQNIILQKWGSQANIERYFINHIQEYSAIIFSLKYLLGSRNITEGVLFSSILKDWITLFTDDTNKKKSNIILSDFLISFQHNNKQPLEQAKLLIANFIGSYRGHTNSLFKKYGFLKTYLKHNSIDKAKKIMPPPLFLSILESIQSVQSYFNTFDFFPLEALEEGKGFMIGLSNNSNTRPFVKWLSDFIVSNNYIKQPSIVKLLNAITPEIGLLLDQQVANYRENLIELEKDKILLEVDNKLIGVNVLGGTDTLRETIDNMLCNAYAAWSDEKRKDDLKISIASFVDAKSNKPVLRVVSNTKFSKYKTFDEVFETYGALATQKKQIQKWNGDIIGYSVPQGTCFEIHLEKIDLESRGEKL